MVDMERRKEIYEKIKFTKLNKLTVIQRDVNVTLNLKVDLLDPDVSIGEKVLCMLENYAKKHTSLKKTDDQVEAKSTSQVSDNANVDRSENPEKEKETNDKEEEHEQEVHKRSESSKIDVVISKPMESVAQNIQKPQLTQANPDVEPIKDASTLAQDLSKLNELEKSLYAQTDSLPSTHPPSSPPLNDRKFMCRLCGLKCSAERSLFDHISRLHGGKCSQTAQASTSGKSDHDDIYTSNNEEDNEAEMSSSSDQLNQSSSKRSSSLKPMSSSKKVRSLDYPQRLNVAIRVAKVAYLNNKSDNKHFEADSKLFEHGFRGNFFSQERLSLRSCKIKMKLNSNAAALANTSSGDERVELENALLGNKQEFKEMSRIDRNTSLVTHHAVNRENRLAENDKDIRDFFKSLIVYIPLMSSSLPTIDDVIKSNETLRDNRRHSESIRLVYNHVIDAKQFGIELAELKRKMPSYELNLLREHLNLLVASFLVLSVGVCKRVYVAYEFKEHWVIRSYKNLKGRSTTSQSQDEAENVQDHDDDDDNHNDEKNDNENENENNELTKNRKKNETTNENRRRTRKKSNIHGTKDKNELNDTNTSTKEGDEDEKSENQNQSNQLQPNLKQFKQVCLIPRPWRYIDGILNRPVLKKMLETILLHLKTYPNSTFESLCKHFSPALQPIMTLELLEMLERLSCVEKISLKQETDCDLNSDFTNGSFLYGNKGDEEMDGNEATCYSCTQESLFIIKKIFPHD